MGEWYKSLKHIHGNGWWVLGDQQTNKQKKTKVNIQEDLQILTLLFLSWVHKWRNKTKNKDGGQYLTLLKNIDGGQFATLGFRSVSQVDLLRLTLELGGPFACLHGGEVAAVPLTGSLISMEKRMELSWGCGLPAEEQWGKRAKVCSGKSSFTETMV